METCSICRKRPAFYLHRSSGNKVCPTCLRNLLLRRIRRTVSRRKMLGPRPRIAYILHTALVWESLPGLRLFARVEKQYGAEITVYHPEGLEHGVNGIETRVYKPLAADTIEEYIEKLASIPGGGDYDAIAIPFSRRAVVAASLASLGRGKTMAAAEPVYTINDIRVINPLYDTMTSDLLAYSYSNNLLEQMKTMDKLGDDVFWTIYIGIGVLEEKNTELLYSAEKGIRYLAEGGGRHRYTLRRTG